MGVPKFYKWLSERYPLINQIANSDIKPEFDNLYLDMNGIIHNCTHSDSPTDGESSKALSDEQMFTGIFKYLEKLFNIARPKKLLYMAIDGVAPRAKMNQQRQRRFRSAKDARENMEAMRSRGEDVDPSAMFDSNCITPGTEFMVTLSRHIRYFIRKKLKEDVAWRDVKVIFSGAEVPGEGEHKIMLYIRNQKSQPNYNPNLRHVLYGLDADLVMLSLVSHEPHFSLLREEVIFGAQGRMPRKILKKEGEFQFLHLSLLREYMDLEFRTALLAPDVATPLPFDYSLERLIDDWVILAFFVGNDFLPHLPTLDIGEGGLDQLLEIYKQELPRMGGYIFEGRQIQWARLEAITARMGALEEDVFAERQETAREFARKQKRKERREAKAVIEVHEDELFEGEPQSSPEPDSAVIRASLEELEEEKKESDAASSAPVVKIFDSQLSMLMRSKDAKHELDEVTGEKLDYESLSFKARYYREKFPEFFDRGATLLRQHSGTASEAQGSAGKIRELVQNYTQGLKWVAAYYYEGCRSWKWYFAYRYAPLASDMVNLASLDLTLQLGYPFRPMEQLLGVLPPASGKFLPAAYRALMDPRTSPVADFYPLDFSIDMNGKRSAWEGIALIPFIDESRLLRALGNISQSQLTESERVRNARYGDEYLLEYDEHNKSTVPSTLPFMSNIVDCHSRETVWHVPSIPMTAEEQAERAAYEAETAEKAKSDPTVLPVPACYAGNFQPRLCDGVVMPAEGYPSLVHSVDSNGGSVSASLQKIAVNVFGMESRKDSLVLAVRPPPNQPVAVLAQRYVGQGVFVDWPYLKEGRVTRITDATHIWTASGARAMGQNEAGTFRTECAIAQQKLMGTKAVDVGAVTIMASVQTFVGMRRAPTGAIVRSFSEDTIYVPWQLIFPTMSNPDSRYAELPPPSLADAFPVGATVIYTGPQNYGAIGHVLAHEADGKTVQVSIKTTPGESAFGRAIAASSKLQFYPSYLVSKTLAIHPLVLSKICSSVFVSQERTDIGLKIKFAKQGLQVPEYARRVDAWNSTGAQGPQGDAARKNNNAADGSSSSSQGSNEGWEYSEKAVALLAAYKRRFPLLFDMMNQEPNTFKYDAERLIQPTPVETNAGAGSMVNGMTQVVPTKTASDAIAEIDAWLKSVGTNHLMLIPCTTQLMAERGIKAVEAEASRLAALRDQQPSVDLVLRNVPIFHLYRPDPVVAWSPTESEAPELGDRVLSLRSDTGVPVGMRGTVVCVHQTRQVEVVFDKEFMSGTHLNHKCSNLRGQTLTFNALLNLSKPKVLAPKNQAAAPQQAAQQQQQKQQQQQAQPKQQQQPKQPQPQQQQQHAQAQQQPQQQQKQQPHPKQPQPHQPKNATPVAAAAAAQPQPHNVQILKRPAAAAAAPAPDVNAASAQLKQMLNIGAAPMQHAPAPVAAAPVVAAPEETPEESMQRLLNKGKARKSKPVAGAGAPVMMGPPLMQGQAYPPMGMPMMYGPPQPFMGPPPQGFYPPPPQAFQPQHPHPHPQQQQQQAPLLPHPSHQQHQHPPQQPPQ